MNEIVDSRIVSAQTITAVSVAAATKLRRFDMSKKTMTYSQWFEYRLNSIRVINRALIGEVKAFNDAHHKLKYAEKRFEKTKNLREALKRDACLRTLRVLAAIIKNYRTSVKTLANDLLNAIGKHYDRINKKELGFDFIRFELKNKVQANKEFQRVSDAVFEMEKITFSIGDYYDRF
jgi:hypothetical protein